MRFTILLLFCLGHFASGAQEAWQSVLSTMPLETRVTQLNRTNCVQVLLGAFRSNALVKGLVFMPGATDEFYMFRRAKAELTNAQPSLLDAVAALTNQTRIRASFRPPLLLLHSEEDNLEPIVRVEHQPTADKLHQNLCLAHVIFNDRDWDALQPILKKQLKADIRPWRHLQESWHFYRHSFAAWNLTDWETLQATALAGKSCFTVRRKQIVFSTDRRVRSAPAKEYVPPAADLK